MQKIIKPVTLILLLTVTLLQVHAQQTSNNATTIRKNTKQAKSTAPAKAKQSAAKPAKTQPVAAPANTAATAVTSTPVETKPPVAKKAPEITYPLNQQSSALRPYVFHKRVININTLGLLQFGPILQAEFKVSKTGYFTTGIRLPYLGLLYHLVNLDSRGDEVTVSPMALGVGAGYKKLFPVQGGTWYAGGVAEYSFGSSTGSDGKDWKSSFSNIALMANGGYRWQWGRKVLSVGAYLGAYTATKDNWWYKSTPDATHDERSTTALGMLELSSVGQGEVWNEEYRRFPGWTLNEFIPCCMTFPLCQTQKQPE